MNDHFNQAVENRRTIYAISKDSPVSKQDIHKIVEHAVKYVPYAFNSQSGRVVILLEEQHDKLWEIARETLRKIVPPENFGSTDAKINSFKSGYGTLLFFEDQDVVKSLQERFALYKDNFPIWSHQASGMLQFVIWTALEEVGLGASLQHYNPLIDEQVKSEWKIPASWTLWAQMPFGKPMAGPDAKEFMPLSERVLLFD